MWSRKQKLRQSAVSSQSRKSSPVLSFIISYHPPLRLAQGLRPRHSARRAARWNLQKSMLHQTVMVKIFFSFLIKDFRRCGATKTNPMFSHLSFWDLCAAILLACLFCHPLDCLWATIRGCGHCCWSLCSFQCCCDPSSLPSVPDINRLCDLCGCLGLRCCMCDCPMCDICLQATECLELAMEISQMLYHWLKHVFFKEEKQTQNQIETFFFNLLKSSGKRATLHKQDTRFAVNSTRVYVRVRHEKYRLCVVIGTSVFWEKPGVLL